MYRNQQPVSAGRVITIVLVLLSAIALKQGIVADAQWYLLLCITIPLLVICAINIYR
jgi:hypothetical protein